MIADLLVLLKEVFIILQILVCPILILLILLQSGKGDDLGTALGGGGGSSSVLGTGGTSKVLVKGTFLLASIFVVNSLVLAWVFKHESERSVGAKIEESITPTEDAAKQLNQEPAKPGSEPVPASPAQPATPAPAPATNP
jgi:preprotein translocase subunit SecG